MKLIYSFLLLLFSIAVCAQRGDQAQQWETRILNNPDLNQQEYRDSITKYDFSSIWIDTAYSACCVVGFIGDNYQRLRIKMTSVTKDKQYPAVYHVTGKSMVRNNICRFSGTIKITAARCFKKMHWGVDWEFKNKGIKKEGILIAEYFFAEDSVQLYSGIFKGVLSTSWYIDKNGQLQYDNIEIESDPYGNNQFVGTWKEYRTLVEKTCNWGDFRIPFSGDLDIGAGGFSPSNKYTQNGWRHYHVPLLDEKEDQWWK